MEFITHVHVGKSPKDKFWEGTERWLDECSYFHTQYWSIILLYYHYPMRRSNNLQATFMCMFIRRAQDRYNDKLIDAIWTETCLEITLHHGNTVALKKSRLAVRSCMPQRHPRRWLILHLISVLFANTLIHLKHRSRFLFPFPFSVFWSLSWLPSEGCRILSSLPLPTLMNTLAKTSQEKRKVF